MLICGWSEEKRRDQLLQSRSIVLSTIDTGRTMIGNINKGDRREKKKEIVVFPFILLFFLLPRATGTQSWNPVVVSFRDSFRAIATYADSSPGATGRFVSG